MDLERNSWSPFLLRQAIYQDLTRSRCLQNFSPRFEQMGAGITGHVLLLRNETDLAANLTEGSWKHEVRLRGCLTG